MLSISPRRGVASVEGHALLGICRILKMPLAKRFFFRPPHLGVVLFSTKTDMFAAFAAFDGMRRRHKRANLTYGRCWTAAFVFARPCCVCPSSILFVGWESIAGNAMDCGFRPKGLVERLHAVRRTRKKKILHGVQFLPQTPPLPLENASENIVSCLLLRACPEPVRYRIRSVF